jgi:hypothetical protein
VARPLPRADSVLAVHSLANRQPSACATSSDATRAATGQDKLARNDFRPGGALNRCVCRSLQETHWVG